MAYRVRHAVAGVEHDAGGAAGRVEGEHGLDGDVPAVGSLVEGQSCFWTRALWMDCECPVWDSRYRAMHMACGVCGSVAQGFGG